MKLFNLFKKEERASNAKFEALNGKQLDTVRGGGPVNTTRSNIKTPTVYDPSSDPSTTGETAIPTLP